MAAEMSGANMAPGLSGEKMAGKKSRHRLKVQAQGWRKMLALGSRC